MSKAANFSFVGELPTYKTSRHCCGFAKVTTIYCILTSILVLQLSYLFISILLPPQLTEPIRKLGDFPESLELFKFVLAGAAVWLILIFCSLIGFFKQNAYLHIPLLFFEFSASFCILSAVGVTLFVWKIADAHETYLNRTICVSVLLLFHAYYVVVLFSLFTDVKSRKETDAFIARQKMLDEVCEEMMWEEEAEKYRSDVLPMTGVYYQECMSHSDGSITSRELSTFYLECPYPERRFVTFYNPDEDSY